MARVSARRRTTLVAASTAVAVLGLGVVLSSVAGPGLGASDGLLSGHRWTQPGTGAYIVFHGNTADEYDGCDGETRAYGAVSPAELTTG
jgi:hypothetical protein